MTIFIAGLLLPLQSFPGNFVDFDKQFWGFDELVRGFTYVRYRLIADQIFGDVIARPGGWLTYSGETSLDVYQNRDLFSDTELEKIQNNLDGLDQRLKAAGIRFLVVIVPGKNTIYPEQIPPQISVIGKQSRTEQLMAYLRSHSNARVLDLTPALRDARKERSVYLATDTHWNAYGILVGYREILSALQPDFPTLKAHTINDYRAVDQGLSSGDLSREWVQGFAQEDMVRLEPRFERRVKTMVLTRDPTPVPGRLVATYQDAPTLPRAVVIHDSFFNEMIPFLADHFSWAVFHWAFQVDEDFVAGEKPDVVILEVTDRYLQRLLEVTR